MVGHHLGQLFLRIGLAVVFLVAGLGKVLPSDEYTGQDAATLANMGVFNPQTTGTPGGGGGGSEAGEDAGNGETRPTSLRLRAQPEEPETRPSRTRPNQPAVRAPEQPAQPEAQPEEESETGSQPEQPATPTTPAPAAAASGPYTAEDFSEPVKLPRVYRIALGLHQGAHPGTNEDGTPKMATIPGWAADTKVPGLGMATPVVLAWAAAIAEVVGGGMLLVGFMTRLWALGLVGVMGTAIWMTTIGPAMQAGTTFLGFLPNHGDIIQDASPYMTAFLQLSLLCMALAVMFAGPGAISIDGILFGGKDEGEGDGE